MKLLIQPNDGVAPILGAIRGARSSIEIAIFRCDRKEIEAELKAAVERGVFVHALVASVNRGGERRLRELELRLLDAGATVTRTVNHLQRYHDKMLLVDRRALYVLSFNYTTADLDHSRGFGLVCENPRYVQQAAKLFEADSRKQPYTPGLADFLVSPLNARERMADFIRKARKELLIYDPKIADLEMVRLLLERARAGVEIRILGRLGKRAVGLTAYELSKLRLHTRTIIRDRRQAFVGSQSLRKAELDSRRELGLIVKDPAVVRELAATFDSDWASRETGDEKKSAAATADVQEHVELIARELPPLASTVKRAVKRAVAKAGEEALSDDRVKQTVKKVVKKAVKEAVKEGVEEAAGNGGGK